MKALFSPPRPLIKKILGTVLIGFGCFILGLAFRLMKRVWLPVEAAVLPEQLKLQCIAPR